MKLKMYYKLIRVCDAVDHGIQLKAPRKVRRIARNLAYRSAVEAERLEMQDPNHPVNQVKGCKA